MNKTTSYPIVGIGFSAGGIEALQTFLANLPDPTGASFVIIPHLSAQNESQLDRVLKRYTHLQIHWITDHVIPQPECAYLLPPGKQLDFQAEAFLLKPRLAEQKINHMIDLGFAALAQAFQRRVIGIVLSGMGNDGLTGARAIEQQGGIVLVQNPETAQFQSMPKSIISHDHPDMVATPKELAGILIRML
ncbi:chemotaxis protein CheB [Cytophagaceae bacterium DM2B3-1]|uniref:protein-glutamate methylesterase n=1 Tax=Xanthocytophaga flava TaxID=3048013 RepID=A0ABT7CPB5_9BACT|nr:chemotaxis protein CheB [Xanthocytophaga flavus]MDJ1494827.1 chemotaxis protein CheB [Xanthocytophaga flavus]